MAPVFSLLRRRPLATAGAVGALASAAYYAWKTSTRKPRRADGTAPQRPSSRGKGKPKVNAKFFAQLVKLLKIVVPSTFSSETGYILMVAAMMFCRTWCDLWMIQNGTAIEAAIIDRSATLFRKHLFKFFAAMLPMAGVNNLLKFGLKEIALRFRNNLTLHLFEGYLQNFTYYKMTNLDNRIANPEQLLTQDVEKFCDSLADLYSNLSKPVLDLFVYAIKLNQTIGPAGPSTMIAYLVFSGAILTKLRSPVTKFTVEEQQLEGRFRYMNSRLITNSEEVAFYHGDEREKQTVFSSFAELMAQLRKSLVFRSSLGMVDTILAKYIATVVGYLVVSRPFLDLAHPRHLNSSHSQLMEDYYQSGRMLVRMSQAVGRLVLAGREVTRLAGFTVRVSELIAVIKDLNGGKYTRTMQQNDDPAFFPGAGNLKEADHVIRFDRVPLVTPNGEVLVKSLDFEVKSGMNVLVCGPNGCGKSSLFRVLGELWPLFGGTLTKPHSSELFYVPQRPYMTVGTLRDQIIYPKTSGDDPLYRDDSFLMPFLQQVHLENLVDRFGWDSEEDWMDILSGGEKQRLAMARMLFHKPQFAILDECTSAVSVDVEGFMYSRCREIGITLFTVSHRKSLWKHHEYALQFDGQGSYEFKKIDPSDPDVFGS